jgi:plastocyanin
MKAGHWRTWASLACAALFLPFAPASAAVVRGTLTVRTAPRPDVHGNAYPGRASSLANPHMMEMGLAGDAVIWLARVPASADTAVRRPRPKLAQKDQCFVPRVLPVAVGAVVDFPNLDPIFHNVFSASPAKRFDLGKYPRGHSKSVTFDKPGLVRVYCDIHSPMEAFVLVLSTHVFAQPDANGAFTLPPVPPGRYTLHIWHPDFDEIQRDVDVSDEGLALELGW